MACCRSKRKKSLSPPPSETNHSPTSCELAMPHRHFCDVSQCVHDVLAPSMTVTRGYARLRNRAGYALCGYAGYAGFGGYDSYNGYTHVLLYHYP